MFKIIRKIINEAPRCKQRGIFLARKIISFAYKERFIFPLCQFIRAAKLRGILSTTNKSKQLLFRLAMILPQIKLAILKRKQKKDFLKNKDNFAKLYNQINEANSDVNEFITSFWKDLNKQYEKALLPFPPFSFLRDKLVSYTMVFTKGGEFLKNRLNFLEEKISQKKLGKVLLEDYVGVPLLVNRNYLASHNGIYHLYHIVKFLNATNVDLDGIKSIVEWGGGYGNLAKIFYRFRQNPTTYYIIIDTPLFSCLQWLYLATVLGKDKINLIQCSQDKIDANKINILPLNFLKDYNLQADLFISTWALSESSVFAQDYVNSKNFFGAKHLLLAFQKSNEFLPEAERIREMVASRGAKAEEIADMPGNYYIFY